MEAHEVLHQYLGSNGKMISYSKSTYREKYADHLVIFNANLCTKNKKIWYGDLDITLEKSNLSTVAVALGMDLYVLRELDGRFENEADPKTDQYVIAFKADGTWEIGKNCPYSNVDLETLQLK